MKRGPGPIVESPEHPCRPRGRRWPAGQATTKASVARTARKRVTPSVSSSSLRKRQSVPSAMIFVGPFPDHFTSFLARQPRRTGRAPRSREPVSGRPPASARSTSPRRFHSRVGLSWRPPSPGVGAAHRESILVRSAITRTELLGDAESCPPASRGTRRAPDGGPSGFAASPYRHASSIVDAVGERAAWPSRRRPLTAPARNGKRDVAAGGEIVRPAKLLNGLDFPCDTGSPGAR